MMGTTPFRAHTHARWAVRMAVIAFATGGCGDGAGPDDPGGLEPIPQLLVSNPVAPTATGVPVTYLAMQPGAFPSGRVVTVSNRRTWRRLTAPLVAGGLDPMAIAAEVGDTIAVEIDTGAGRPVRAAVLAPAHADLRVVRTEPVSGRPDVNLDARVVVVFSEPVEPATLEAGPAVLELDSTAVSGAIEISPGALAATFIPAASLLPEAEYRIVLGAGLRGLDGGGLGAPVAVTFRTAAGPGPLGPDSFPLLPPTALVYGRTSPISDPTGAASRVVLYANGNFALQFAHRPGVVDEYTGRYSRVGSTVILHFQLTGVAWQATGVLAGDSLSVAYNFAMQMAGFDDGVYVRGQLVPPPPSGVGIAFASSRSGSNGIYVARPDGSALTWLADGFQPAWSPDGRRLAFVRVAGDEGRIWVMNADGSGQTRLGEGWTPSWSPDGAQIVFSLQTAILVMNADGSGRTELIRLPFPGAPTGADQLSRPRWSPDGGRIAFDSRGGDEPLHWQQVHLMDADGSNVRALSDDGFGKFHPSWSPDGTRIAVQTYDYVAGDSLSIDIVLATYDVGSGRREIHYRSQVPWLGNLEPDYSPDGRTLAFTRQLPEDRSRVVLLDLGTGVARLLLPDAVSPASPDYADHGPAWSSQ